MQTGRGGGNDPPVETRRRERATQSQEERSTRDPEAGRRAGEPWPATAPRPRRRHPQRTLRIRHGLASFGRYYFAPEKKINTKKVWILSGDQSFSVWRGWGGGG